MDPQFAGRLGSLRESLRSTRADLWIETHLPNVYYLSGFTGEAGVLAVEPSRVTLFTDGRFSVQAREEAPGTRIVIQRGPLLAAVGKFLRRKRSTRVGLAPSRLSLAGWTALKSAAGRGVRWRQAEGMVERLRAVKDAGELERMRQAARVGSEVMLETIAMVRPGVTELDLAAEIGYRMRKKGASGESFDAIVASGPRSALPHARPTTRQIGKNELVVLDLGAILRHYCSDLTRTVYVGQAPARIREWFNAVRDAQAAARDAAMPGVPAAKVDAAARSVLTRRGLGKFFVHSTGHGLGLEVHEEPRIVRGQKRTLESGNVITLEPGAYVEGVGGIRIEDDAHITPRGAEILTTAPRELLEL